MKGSLLSIAWTVAAIVVADGAAAQTHEMKIGLATVNDSQHLLANRLAEQISSRSSGQIRPSVFPASQLGSNQRMIEGVQLGTLELVLGPPGFLASLNPGFQAVDAPAVFDDIAHAQRTITNADFRTPYLELGSQSGVTGVLIYAATMFSYTFPQPVTGVADFRGKKIRVLGTRIEREIVSALGGTGVPMSFADAVPALQNGTVDGIRAAPIVNTPLKLYDVAKYTLLTNEALAATFGAASKQWLDALPAALRKVVIEACAENELWAFDTARELERKAEDGWREAGGKLIALSAADRKELAARTAEVGERVMRENPRTRDMYELLRATANKTRGLPRP